jgi:hypothetical protein
VAARVKECPIAVVQAAYIRAARDLCKRSEFLRRNVPSTALVPNQPLYNFGTDPNLEIIDIKAVAIQQLAPSFTWVNLHNTPQDTYDPNMAADIPNWYSYVPEGMITYYPTPNLAYNTKVELIVQPLQTATAISNDLVNKFNLYIEEGALWHLYSMPKEPWYNPIERDKSQMLFFEGIGMGKSWVDRGFQRGSVRATPRPFIAR